MNRWVALILAAATGRRFALYWTERLNGPDGPEWRDIDIKWQPADWRAAFGIAEDLERDRLLVRDIRWGIARDDDE